MNMLTKLGLALVACGLLVAHFAHAEEAQPEEKPQTLFTNVNIYDGLTPKLIENANVLVEGNLIKAVSTNPIKADGATIIDGGGRTLTPGLIDSHTHLSLVAPLDQVGEMDWGEIGVRMAVIAEDQLMRGFTTVRDLCGNTHGLRAAINAGAAPGPRIVSAGACISPRSGHGDFYGYNIQKGEHPLERYGIVRIVDGPTEIRTAIREEFRKGASFIKLMMGGGLASAYDPLDVTTLQPDEVEAAVRETENWGTYATAHIYTDRGINMGLDAGMKTFEHTHLASRETYERFAKEGIVISAQVHAIGQLKGYPSFTTPAQKKKAAYLADNGEATFGYIKDLDLKVGFGADFWGDIPQQRVNSEAIAGRKKYFDNDMVLEQLFANNVILLEMTGERLPYTDGPLGVIKEGAYADILLVEGDPTKDVAVFADWENKIDLVMKDGVIYRKAL
ncbi:MAG: amidohydrolase family protein [Chromatiaceae bacterium]|jgi:imidazolonepropionase-like amidohydrolase